MEMTTKGKVLALSLMAKPNYFGKVLALSLMAKPNYFGWASKALERFKQIFVNI